MPKLTFPPRGRAALRRGRHSECGRIYLVTFTCQGRATLFKEWGVASHVARISTELQLWRGSRLLCWVLMPDHWHGLVQLSDAESLATLIGRVKAITARAANAARGHAGRVWSKGYHDHALRADEDQLAIARYIIGNPVRAGLCERAGQYPYWGATWIE